MFAATTCIAAAVNPILRGWGKYFRTGNAAKTFNQIERYRVWRVARWMRKRHGRDLKPGRYAIGMREWLEAQGLCRLRGTVRYPGVAL